MPVKTITATGVVTGIPKPLIVKSIRWLFASAAGQQVRIEDESGAILWRSVAGGSNNVEESITQREWVNGVNVVTLGGGELDIDYELKGSTLY